MLISRTCGASWQLGDGDHGGWSGGGRKVGRRRRCGRRRPSPLIEIPLEGASGILVNVAGGQDLGIHEIQTVVNELKQLASPDARIVFGAVVDPTPMQTLSVTLIATGFCEGAISSRDPWSRRAATATSEAAAPAEAEIREVTQPLETDPENSEVPAFIRRQRQE